MKHFPLPLRLTVPLLVFLLGGLTAAWAFQQKIRLSSYRAEERLHWEAKSTGLRTTGLLEYIFRRNEAAGMETEGADLILRQLVGNPDLRAVLLLDETDHVRLATNHPALRGQVLQKTAWAPLTPTLQQVRQRMTGQVIIRQQEGRVQAVYPFYLRSLPGELAPSRVGVLLLEYDLSRQKQEAFRDAVAQSLQNIAVVAGLCLGAWVLFEQILTRRAARLVAVSQRFAQGDLAARIQLGGSDELAQIARAFDAMADRVQQDTEALQASEAQQRQQTQELAQSLADLQAMQSQLIQAEKMSSLGQLVAGIAHEINNPVNFIHGNLGYAEEYAQDLLSLVNLYEQEYPQSTPALQAKLNEIDINFLIKDFLKILNSMKMGTNRIREIVLSLRNFSRLDEADMKQVDLHEGIDSTVLILQHRLAANPNRPAIQVEKHYGKLPRVECYAGQLNQVFTNIIANAIDALEDKYKTQAQTTQDAAIAPTAPGLNTHRAIPSTPVPTVSIRTQTLDSDHVRIEITDNGLGLPEEVKQKIFNPFFTTKPVGKGTGLGLSISYKIVVEKHQGRLDCQGIPGEGTIFSIEIPISPSPAAALA
jgi:signal transduction histidine kinase